MTKMKQCETWIWILLMTIEFTACQDFDIFVFSEQWPPATCIKGRQEKKTCKMPLVYNYWTIHGLWPCSSSGDNPKYCPGPSFNFSQISNLTEELISYWPDIYDKRSIQGLWNHEWTCHGTCAQTIPATKNERRYFKKNLELIKKFNITSILSNHNVSPSEGNPYSPTIILDILKKDLGHAPLLICIEDEVRF
ncbi:hypothetical protein CHS0354_040006 [Potamilus streckersoni]|uniref:Uncharacterized protein n=1 Tax=Potamilus streckersoni TaxID=2493646 RepID=A0AAE0STH9_9BIVA|nr:hypothetical protein CHS0354_040006 [Potamilus streckersoni]